jgi:anti-sigma-K factor RskA
VTDPEIDACGPFADLLGAYALDALDDDEAAQVANHLAGCPRCSQEVDDHRETIALLAAAGGPAPEGIWERIASSIADDTDRSAQAPPHLVRPPRRRAWVRPAWAAALAAAAAVAVLVGVQTARVDQLNHRVDQLSNAARQSGGFQGLAAALVDPTARHYTLVSTGSGGRELGQLVVLPSGASYMFATHMPQLASDRTYQLWSLVKGRAVSVGLLGTNPGTVAFTVDPSFVATAYMVTVEPAGGVVAPTAAPVAQATA